VIGFTSPQSAAMNLIALSETWIAASNAKPASIDLGMDESPCYFAMVPERVSRAARSADPS
jgi:hypothetical protein